MDQQEELNKLREEVSDLKQKLKDANKKKPFWDFSSGKDWITLLSLPMAVILGLYSFYDNVWLRFRGHDAETVSQVIDGLAQLQALDQSTFVKQADGDSAGAGAVDAAQRGQRERLTARAFDYWQRSPEFFQRGELDTLAHHLILQRRTKDAIQILDSLSMQANGAYDKTDLWLKKARAYGAEGDAFDLTLARSSLDRALMQAESINARGTRNSAITNITFYRVFMELQNEQDCKYITPYIMPLAELNASGTDAQSSIDEQIAQLVDIHNHRCRDE